MSRNPANRRQLALNRRRLALNRRRLALNRRRLALNGRRLALNRRRLALNRRRVPQDRPQALAGRCSAEVRVYRRPAVSSLLHPRTALGLRGTPPPPPPPQVVPQRMEEVHDAILRRDFPRFAEITMRDSDHLREVCLSSTPVIDYWTPQSKAVVRFVGEFNAFFGAARAAYTFDAGPNAFLFTTTPDLACLLKAALHVFPTAPAQWLFQDDALAQRVADCALPDGLAAALTVYGEGFTYIFHSQVGHGPSVETDPGAALIDAEGRPVNV